MKITKQYLQKIIKEEISRALGEGFDPDELDYRASQPNVPPKPIPSDPLEGVELDPSDPKKLEHSADAMWKEYISVGKNPNTKQPFKDKILAQATFIQRYMTTHPRDASPEVLKKARELGAAHNKYMYGK